MRKPTKYKIWWASLMTLLGLGMTAVAQQGARTPSDESTETLRVNSSIVNMLFTVRDSDGRLIKNLGREQFHVADDGRPQPIAYFAEDSDQPLSLAVVFDKSNSVKSHFEFQRKATADFVRSVLRPGKDRALLITFDKQAHLAVPFTDRSENVEQGMAGLDAEGGTALFDAARLAIEQYLSSSGPQRRVLILVTDGEDTVSWTTEGEVSSLALSRNVIIYTLGIKPDGPGNHGRARRHIERMSEDTGGLALFPKDNPKELAELFGRVQEELRHQYSLGYSLPPPDGKVFHQVEIEPPNKAYKLRTRRGYFTVAPPLTPAIP